MSIKDEYRIVSIEPKLTHEWLLRKHYAKRIPIIMYSFGLYDNENILQGVCTFGYPARMLMQSVDCEIFELNRLVVTDKLCKNVLSYFVSKCFNILPKPVMLMKTKIITAIFIKQLIGFIQV